MAGIGAISFTVEKSKDLTDLLVKKGEETAAARQIDIEQMRDQAGEQVKAFFDKLGSDLRKASFEDLLDRADDLTDEERAILMDRLAHPQPRPEEPCEDEDKPCDGEACGEDGAQDASCEADETPADKEDADKAE